MLGCRQIKIERDVLTYVLYPALEVPEVIRGVNEAYLHELFDNISPLLTVERTFPYNDDQEFVSIVVRKPDSQTP